MSDDRLNVQVALDQLYVELYRRLSNPNSQDKIAQEFQWRCKRDGAPVEAHSVTKNTNHKRTCNPSTCDDCGAPMPIPYEGDGGSTYCAKCAGAVETPKMSKRSDARWWSGVPMTDKDVLECAITGGWTPSKENSVSDAINFLAKNGHKIYKLKPTNDK